MLVVSVSLNVIYLSVSFTVPFVLSSSFPTLLSFVNFQFGFFFGSEGAADVVRDWGTRS